MARPNLARIMMEYPHFPRSFVHRAPGLLPVFDIVIDLHAIFDREQWISTPGCAILNFDSTARKRVVFA
jgi:hypothetical protein